MSHNFPALLAFTADDKWEPGIGDPTVMGWVTVVGYVIAAVLCWRIAFLARSRTVLRAAGPQHMFGFWLSFAILMTLLGINKQLDLQTWFTLFGKHLALDEGWYEQRRAVQAVFIALVALGGLMSVATLFWFTRKILRETWLSLVGAVFLCCFVLVRAASFHHVDQMLGMELGGLKVNWILELGGILWIGISAWKNLRRLKSQPAPVRGPNFLWLSAPAEVRKK